MQGLYINVHIHKGLGEAFHKDGLTGNGRAGQSGQHRGSEKCFQIHRHIQIQHNCLQILEHRGCTQHSRKPHNRTYRQHGIQTGGTAALNGCLDIFDPFQLSQHDQQNSYCQRKQDAGGGSPAGGHNNRSQHHKERKDRNAKSWQLHLILFLLIFRIHGQQFFHAVFFSALLLRIIEIYKIADGRNGCKQERQNRGRAQ